MLVTFHKIVEGCAEGRRDAWLAFVTEYTPVCLRLIEVHLRPEGAAQAPQVWRSALAELAGQGSERLQSLDRQSEKEFLLGLRRLLLTEAAGPDESQNPEASAPALETVNDALRGLPLAQQEIVFLKLAGYDAATIEKLLRVTPTVIERALDARRHLGTPERAEWLRLLRHIWASKTESCAAPRQLIRIQDGQATWYDRDPVEQHMAGCLHCLELWTALAEVRYWRREARPLAAKEATTMLDSLGIARARAK